MDKRPCYRCGKEETHINDGGNAWIAYQDEDTTVFYCNTEECSAFIVSCCDCIDVVNGSHCPDCGSLAVALSTIFYENTVEDLKGES